MRRAFIPHVEGGPSLDIESEPSAESTLLPARSSVNYCADQEIMPPPSQRQKQSEGQHQEDGDKNRKHRRRHKGLKFLSGLMAWKKRAAPVVKLHQRLIDRDSTYHQSYGRWNIDRNTKDDHIRTLFNNDRFHTVLHMTTWKVLSYLFFAYLAVVSTFALIYLIISHFDGCNMGIVDYREAYYFSLETMTTVGYGTQDVFFGRCWSVMVIITAQACCGLLIDALLIGVLFARLARPQTRASTVVFSNKAVLRRIRGEYYFMFQVGELRKHQLLETKVRCYAVRHHRTLPIDAAGCLDDANPPETVHYQTHNMRLQHPDDELGGALLLVLPQLVVHRVDAWSPLMPPPRWVSASGIVQWGVHEDCDWNRAPWESPSSPEDSPTAGGAAGEQHQFTEPGKMLKRQTAYWDSVQQDPYKGGEDSEKGPGYVYRFPDLLKRWDDIDGERGTWYERMKRRCTLMEHARQERVLRAKAYKASLAEAAAAGSAAAGDAPPPPLPPPLLRAKSTALPLMNIVHDHEILENPSAATTTAASSMSGSPQASEASSAQGGSVRQRQRKSAPMDAKLWFAQEERRAIAAFVKDRELEVVVIVEGIDTSTGSTVQCRYSYAVDNMVWDHAIGPCVTKDADGKCVVDFLKFHDVRAAPPDCIDSGFVQSYA